MKRHKAYGAYELIFKRFVDIICSFLVLIFLGWLLFLLAILVRIKLGKPVLFCQERIGKDCKVFKLYKFRTMTDERDASGELLPDVVRLTPFGKFLRTTSLDELPEVINILKGDMSLIGPRPLVTQYLPYYTEEENQRHDVRPGLSGWAQVNGRNSVNWEERFAYDVDYVKKITFLRDVRIILLTVKTAVKREDIGVRGESAPMDFDQYRRMQRGE